jgi:putative membrane protein
MSDAYYRLALMVGVLAVLLWSAIGPHDRVTWWLETAPVWAGLAVLILTHQRFPLTRLAYTLIAVHMLILCVGGHYTYALVPAGEWVRDMVDGTRNNYDKLGHFWQGFCPAIVARELIVRTSPLRSGGWLYFLVLCFALALSAVYELIEWAVALLSEEAADAFLGTQGYIWDTQSDMWWCGVGALTALTSLSRVHDRQVRNLV